MLIVLYAHLIYMFSEVTVKPVNYEALTDDLIENYAPEEFPELYSLYTSMLNHLMKCFKLKNSTAVKLLLKVEERLGIHLYRNRELTQMSMINVKKGNDIKRYFRTLYWSSKIPLEIISEIYNKYNDISSDIVKRYMHETGKLSDNQIADYEYARNYYHAHHEAILERKRAYRARKKKEKENEKIHSKINQVA